MTNIKSQQLRDVIPANRARHSLRKMSSNTSSHKRILLIAPAPPFPLENGTNQRTLLMWKALSEIAPVDVILCDDLVNPRTNVTASVPASLNFLGRFPWRSKGYWLYRLFGKTTPSPTLERLLRAALPRDWDYEVDRQVSRSLSAVFARSHYFLAVGRYLKPIVKTGLVGRLPCLLDIDDVDFDIRVQLAQDVTRPRWRRLINSMHTSQIRAAFQKWLTKFDGLSVTKAGDTRHTVTRDATILPNIPYHFPAFLDPPDGSRSARPIILTVGLLSYQPNRNGVDRFIREGWPKV